MKHWIVFIALFSMNQAIACGPWYPYGEGVRFSLFSPEMFDDGSMSRFYYTADNYGSDAISTEINDPNCQLWSEYCNGKVALADIFNAVYTIELKDFESRNTSHPMIQYLLEQKDNPAIAYLTFAKSCSALNSLEDPWEKHDGSLRGRRNKKISIALKRAKKAKNPQLKKRYQFLALRLAFYNGDHSELEKNYQANFASTEHKDLLDYWALHYVSILSPSSEQTNFNLAQVFAHAPGKRFAINLAFDRKISLEKVLSFANTDEERANVYIMYAIREKGRSDEVIKKVYALNPNSPLLNFLIVREINKIEDWILTPRYSMFPPSMSNGEFYATRASELMEKRLKSDRGYAEKLAFWLRSAKWSNAEDAQFANLSACYLFGTAGSDFYAKEMSEKLQVASPLEELRDQVLLLHQVRFDQLTKLSTSDQLLLMDDKSPNNSSFLFAIAREYEFNSNHTMAAAFFSRLNVNGGYTSWRSPDNYATMWADYYMDWFFYLEGQYTVLQVEKVIDFANEQLSSNDTYGKWLREHLKPQVNRLHDLLGTKHIRQDNIEQAVIAFKKVKPGLWDSPNYPYMTYLDANPFYTDFNSEHSKTPGDTVVYNKLQIAQKLHNYLELAHNPQTENRAYYFFQVANCYFNMSHHGNSWMMRRYYWSRNTMESNLEDESDYLGCKSARKYYLMAMKYSPTKDLKSLCLRMAGRCEDYQLDYETEYDYTFDYDKYGGYHKYIQSKNKSFASLKKSYPNNYETMMGNCTTFEKYYAQFN